MIAVVFPLFPFKIKQSGGQDFVFDGLRKQWLLLTPEEWVRQNFIQYLVQTQQYPQNLLAIEKEITIGDVKRRFDIVVYSRQTQPWMLIECKAMDVPLTDSTIEQVLRYNQKLQASYIVVTNGSFTRCFQLQPEVLELSTMPKWPDK